jgi:hypothetical protein
MPKPVPPPPPQPSVEETRAAVRYAWGVMLAAALIFFAVASQYGPDTYFMRFGRQEAVSWNVWKAERLDEQALRAHEGGRILWVVGSSITRDSFDEGAVNEALAEAGSPYRLAKFGFTRGAPGVSLGLAERLPIREGDVLATSVAAENFRRDWVTTVGPPPDLLMKTVSPAGFWSISEWTLADKLEQAAAVPNDFYAWHDETMDGMWSWAVDRIWYLRRPRKAKAGWRLRHRNPEVETEQLDRGRALGQASAFYIPPGDLDFSDAQFNVAGLQGYAALAESRGAELVLLSIPTRQEYVARFLAPDVRRDFSAWLAGRDDIVYFPQPDESHYYDWKHPRREGRATLSARLVEWLDSRDPGAPVPVDWPAPGYNLETRPPRPVEMESP